MDQNEYRYEQQYRKVIGAIGISMLFFLLFLTAMFIALSVLLLLIVVKLYRQGQTDESEFDDRL